MRMTTKTINALEELDKCIEILKKRAKKKHKHTTKVVKPEEGVKKKGKPHKEIKYKSFMKVASIAAILVCTYLLLSMLYIPNLRDVVIAFFENLSFINFGPDTGKPTDYVN